MPPIWCRARDFAPSTPFLEIWRPSLHNIHRNGHLSSRVALHCAHRSERCSLSPPDILSQTPRQDSIRAGTGSHSGPEDDMIRLRHGSYPLSHIASRSSPVAISWLLARDTQKSRPHVVVVLPTYPTAPLGLCIPGMTPSLPGEHQPLCARRATPPSNGHDNRVQV